MELVSGFKRRRRADLGGVDRLTGVRSVSSKKVSTDPLYDSTDKYRNVAKILEPEELIVS